MTRFSGKLCLSIINIFLLLPFGTADIELEESFVENAKILAGVVERVTELEHEMKFLEKAVLGEEFSEVLTDEAVKPPELSQVTASISTIFGGIEFKIKHELKDVIRANWNWNSNVLAETKYIQMREPKQVSMIVPSSELQTGFENGRLVMISAYIETSDETVFTFLFSQQLIIEFMNATNPPENVESVSEKINIWMPTISPGKNIGYLPGEEIVLRIGERYRNDSEIMWSFYAVSDRPDDPIAITLYSHSQDAPINITMESKSNRSDLKAEINTTSMSTGGIIFLREWSSLHGEVVDDFHSLQTIYLHLRTQKDPIPINRVAIDSREFFSSQHKDLYNSESPVTCEAIGNPTPQMEFREDGHRMDLEYDEWPWKYGNQITALVPNNVHYHGITCHAKSGDGVAEKTIKLTVPMRVVEEESEIRRISDDVIAVICSIQGAPIPTISFYKGSAWPENLLSQDLYNASITEVTKGFTTTSTLILETSYIKNLWEITCVGKSDGRETYKYFPVV